MTFSRGGDHLTNIVRMPAGSDRQRTNLERRGGAGGPPSIAPRAECDFARRRCGRPWIVRTENVRHIEETGRCAAWSPALTVIDSLESPRCPEPAQDRPSWLLLRNDR